MNCVGKGLFDFILADGDWQLATCFRQLAISDWRLVAGYWRPTSGNRLLANFGSNSGHVIKF